MPLTNYADTALIDLLFGAVAYTTPVTLYAALSTTTPTQAGATFTEPSGLGYARVAVTNNTTNFVAAATQPATGHEVENGTAITFPAATGSWGTITYVGFYDAATAGNLLTFAALTTAQTVASGDTLSFAIDAITITLN